MKRTKHNPLERELHDEKTKKWKEKFEVMISQQMERFEVMIKEQKDQGKNKDWKDKRIMTSKRDFLFSPEHSGKHDDIDEWKFEMSTVLSEEK